MALRTMLQHVVKSTSSSLPALAANSARAYSTKFVNHVELLGRVGREPQKIGGNDAVAFPFYTESTMKFKDGSVKSYPCWHKILVVRKAMAEIVLNAVERGQRCYISGRIAYRAAEPNEDGKMMYNHQAAIIAENIVFLEKSRKGRLEESTDEPKEAFINN